MKPANFISGIYATLTAGALALASPGFAKPEDSPAAPATPAAQAPKAVAPAAEKPTINAIAKAARIDELVEQKLTAQKIHPNELASDEVFLRRVYLDVIGRTPTKKEALTFLNAKEADKRPKLIDELLASDGYEQNYFNFWADVLRLKSLTIGGGQTLPAGLAYSRWLREALRSNKPYDQLVRELLSAQGKTYENGAVGFYIRDYNMPLDNMAVTTQIFLGAQIVCAQCHNHPFDKWTQMDYYQIAAHSYGMTGTNALLNPAFNSAVYGGTKKAGGQGVITYKADERKEISKAMTEILRPLRYNTVVGYDNKALKLPHDYKYDDAKPLQTIAPTIPASMSKEGKIIKEGESPIASYAKWVTAPENPRFTVVIANRLWKRVMGMGVIEPVDQITDSTVPSNPELMTYLEGLMKETRYDMKAYLCCLLNSMTYQRRAYNKDVDLGDAYYFPGPLVRRMTAEQVWDSLVALYKPGCDRPSKARELETDELLTKIEWWDRALNTESVEELVEGAKKISDVQRKLSDDVRQAQVALKEAQARHDEPAIREAKQVAAQQRKRIDEAVEKIVYEVGFEKFAELAKKNQLRQQVDDPVFAREIAFTIKKKTEGGEALKMDDALELLLSQKKKSYADALKARRDKEMLNFKVQSKGEHTQYQAYASAVESTMLRAADLRSPAPNGHFLRVFGQSDRELVNNANEDASVMQSLMMLNGRYFKSLLNPYTVISRQLKNLKSTDEALDTMYLSLLSRHATAEELALLRPLVTTPPTPAPASANPAPKQGNAAPPPALSTYASALWALLNTRQFLFIE